MKKSLLLTLTSYLTGIVIMHAQVGTNDPTFNPGTGFNLGVLSTAVQTDGKILAGGTFTTYNGATKNRIARINSDGTIDASFITSGGVNNSVYKVGVLSSGQIMLCGQFTTCGGVSAKRLVRINTNGSKDAAFTSSVAANGFVYTFAEQPDAKVLIGGAFTSFAGATRNRICRVNTNGSNDGTFNPGTGANNSVYSIAVQSNGSVLLGGSFTTFNSVSKVRLTRLTSTGAADPTFTVGTGVTGTGTNVAVYSIAVQPDGKILIGGFFAGYNGTAKNNIIRLNSNGTLDATFNTGTGANNYVKAITVQSDGKIILTGAFTMYNGVSKSRIVRLNSNGTIDNTFNGTGANSTIQCHQLQANNDLIIGGDFTTYSGVSRTRIARVNNACPTLTTSLTGLTNNLCFGGSTGSATVSASGGTTFTYTWLPSGGNLAIASGLSAGTYSCIVNNECLNSSTVTATITQPSSISLTTGPSSTVCIGGNASITANATGGTGAISYVWQPGNLSGANQTVTVNSATIFTVTATDANGCSATAMQTIDVYALPSVSISGGTTSVCSGNTSSLTASGASSYLWNTGANTSIIAVTPSVTTTFTVTGTDVNGCSNNATKTVTVSGTCAVSSVPCGTIVTSLYASASAANVTGATQYRFKFYNNTTNALVGSLIQATRTLTFSSVGTLYYGNTYKWTVAVNKGSGFGPESSNACTITFAAPKSSVPCGVSYSNINDYSACPSVASVTNYRFSFYNSSTNALIAVKTQTSNYIYFNQVPGLNYGNTYKWTVEVEYNNGTGLVFGPASSNTCTLTFNPPQTKLSCGQTYTSTSAYTAVVAPSVQRATGSRFTIQLLLLYLP